MTANKGRLAGALWLVVIVVSMAGYLVRLSAPRVDFAANLLGGAVYLGVTVLLYEICEPVNGTLARFGAMCGLAGVATGAATSVTNVTPPEQGFYLGMVFFGLQCMSVGYLLARAALVPRVLGVLLAIGGTGYVVNSFANFLAPAVGVHFAPFVIPLALLGEGSLTLWLLAKGVRA